MARVKKKKIKNNCSNVASHNRFPQNVQAIIVFTTHFPAHDRSQNKKLPTINGAERGLVAVSIRFVLHIFLLFHSGYVNVSSSALYYQQETRA